MSQITKSTRLLSLDTLRGYTIAAMILVNFPGSESFVYHPFQHSHWNGLTFTDLIAPTFLFIVGVSIALAYTPKLNLQRTYLPENSNTLLENIRCGDVPQPAARL
ncbi:uncharacterized protein DUF1624 [Dyadobacter jejuensis]|uniref:Uncharacterized protein DUF1624 n=1 Tax=Dyadobacter jejuensis TaxID=1082580 RepID=A0A316AJ29_9BACT|nr:heparan-alpha-glucosaminide N-acetyltransferase domain-containing protein [Dyadobacter jejuensis]PWJ57743.1 uncharacterized protein DUF1624 [Dyadobacter jejuensis]